ncbi:titin-like isoform X1 [Actinia tenebrosa]|uniref:Titin-like isoform X1 n=1 Tax=Actinia tenebrosa TaxID=6105 RepID=A0A6P8H8G3_ACTTE|nr:titin-like isoform X1 [Actinia tenebrosa]
MSSFWAKFTEPLPNVPAKPNNASAIFGGHSPYGLRATEPSIFRSKEKPSSTRKSARSNSDAGLTKTEKQKSKDSSSKRKLSESRLKSNSAQNTANKNRPVSPRSNAKESVEGTEEDNLTDSQDSGSSNGDRYPLFISVKKGSAADAAEVKPRKAINGLNEDKQQEQSLNGQIQKEQKKVKRSSSFSSPRKTIESVSSSSAQYKSPVKPRGASNQNTEIPTKGRSPIDSFRREKSDIIVRPRTSCSPSTNRKENTFFSNSKGSHSPSALKREKSDITPRRAQKPPFGVLRENSDLVRPRGSASPSALRREKSDVVSPRRSPGIGKRQKSDITLKKKTTANTTPCSSTDTINSCESHSEALTKVLDHKENMSKIPTPAGTNPPSKIPSFTKTSSIPQSKIPPKSKIPSIGKADKKEEQAKKSQIPTGIPRSDKSTSKLPGPPRPDSAKENKDPGINRKDSEEEAIKPVKNEIKVSRIPSAKGVSKIPRQDSLKSTGTDDDTDNVFADEHEAVSNGNATEKVHASRIPSTGVSKIPSFSKTNGPSKLKSPEVVSPVSKIPQNVGFGLSGIPSPTVHAKPEIGHSGIPAPTVLAKPETAHSGIKPPAVHAKPETTHSGIPPPAVHAKPETAHGGIKPPAVHAKPETAHSGIPPPTVHAKPETAHSGIPAPKVHAKPGVHSGIPPPTVHAKPEKLAFGIPKPDDKTSAPVSGIPKPEGKASSTTAESKIPQFSPTESVPKSKIPGLPGSILTRKLSEEKFKKTNEIPAEKTAETRMETPKEEISAKPSEGLGDVSVPATTVPSTPSGKVAPPPPPRQDVKNEEIKKEEEAHPDSPMDKYIFSEAKRMEELLRNESIIVEVPSNEEEAVKRKDVEAKAEVAKLSFQKGPEAKEMVTSVSEVCEDNKKEAAKKEAVLFSTFGKKEDSGVTNEKGVPKETPKQDVFKEEGKKDVFEEEKPVEEKTQESNENVVEAQSPTDENKPAIDTLGQYEQQSRRSRSRQRKVISPDSEQPETTFEQTASEDDTKKVIDKDKFGTQPFEAEETKDSQVKPANKPAAKGKSKHDKPKFVIESSLGADFYQSKTSQSKESITAEDTAEKPAEVIVIENKTFDDSKAAKATKAKDVGSNKKNQSKEKQGAEAFEDVDLSSHKGSKMEMRAWSMDELDEKTVKCACGRGGKCSIM